MINYNIHNLVEISINDNSSEEIINAIDFQIGYFRVDSNLISAPYQILIKPFNDFLLNPDLNYIIFHLIKGITKTCYYNPNGKLAIVKEKNKFQIYADSPNFLINLFIQLFLVDQGITFVHAAAIADNEGNVILLPGAGGVGKTALLGELVKTKNYRLLGDDIVGLCENGECFCFPRSFVLKEYHSTVYPEIFKKLNLNSSSNKYQKNRKELFFSIKCVIKDNAPFLGLTRIILKKMGLLELMAQQFILPDNPSYLAAVPVEEIFGLDSVLTKGQIKNIIFMERYIGEKFNLESLSEEELCRRMFAIIHHEWVDSMRQFFSLCALEIVDLPLYNHEVFEIMKNGISGKKSQILLIPEGKSPKELVDYFLSLNLQVEGNSKS